MKQIQLFETYRNHYGKEVIKPTYPQVAGYKERGASKEAAEKFEPCAKTLRNQVWQIFESGKQLTADEVACKLGVSLLSVRPRVSELAAQGLIKKTGERRENESGLMANVWGRI